LRRGIKTSEKAFFDWESDLRAGSQIKKDHDYQEKKQKIHINKIGLPEDIFKNFLKNWKKQNLKDVK
jgi:hypothetical protein